MTDFLKKPLVKVLMLKGEKGETGDVSKENFDKSINTLNDLISNNRSRIDNLIVSSGSDSSAEVIDARTGYDGTVYDTLGEAVRTQASDMKKEIVKFKDFDYCYLPRYTEANQNKYWSSAGTMNNVDGWVAFNPFKVNAGTYYYNSINGALSFAKTQSGNVVKLEGKNYIELEETATLYITANDTQKENAFFGNYQSYLNKTHNYGLNYIPFDYISNASDAFVPVQYLDSKNGYDGRYWNGVNSLLKESTYFAYNPLKLKKGTYYYRNVSPILTFFYGYESKTTTKPLTNGSNEFTLNEDGILYVSVAKSVMNYEDSIICNANYPESIGQYKGRLFNLVPKYKLIENVNNDYLLKNQFNATSGAVLNGKVCTINTDSNGISTQLFTTISSNVVVSYDFNYTGTDNIKVFLLINKNDDSKKYITEYESNKNGSVKGSFTFDASSYSVYENAKSYKILIFGNANSSFEINDISVRETSKLENSNYYKDNLEDMLSSLSDGIDNVESKIISSCATLSNPNGDKYDLQVDKNGNLVLSSHIPSKYVVMGNSITCGMDNSGTHGGMFGMASTSFDKDWVYHVDSAIKEKNHNATYTRIYASNFEHSETDESANEWITNNLTSFTQDTDLVLIEMGDNVNTDAKTNVFKKSFPLLLHTIRTRCPKARIVCVGIWFNHEKAKEIMLSACKKYGCQFVNISDLNITINQATVGDTVTYLDGTTSTITEEISAHPGDNGMKLIADRVIEGLDM